jgi:hypothetical protein
LRQPGDRWIESDDAGLWEVWEDGDGTRSIWIGPSRHKQVEEIASTDDPKTAHLTRMAHAEPPWPAPLGGAAYHGIVGEIVRSIEPHTEADPAALLVQLVVACGSAMGRNAHHVVEADRHYSNLYVALVGQTARGRKGTSWGHVRRIVEAATASQLSPESEWNRRVLSGLVSGEGLIFHVRDPVERTGKDGDPEVVDAGEADKRLCVVEPELARVLAATARDGNTLSAVIRDAWDRGDLAVLARGREARNRATGAHVSIIGHITRDELRRTLTATESANGFANRIVWICVRRARLLAEGGSWRVADHSDLVQRLGDAIARGAGVGELRRSRAARELWISVYPDLSREIPGLLGAVTARAEAIVMRLALVYAVASRAKAIGAAHLRAGLEIWRYSMDSARYIFGEALGDPTADALLGALRRAPDGLTRTDLSGVLGRHASTAEIERALSVLAAAGYVSRETVATRGRPVERWRAS